MILSIKLKLKNQKYWLAPRKANGVKQIVPNSSAEYEYRIRSFRLIYPIYFPKISETIILATSNVAKMKLKWIELRCSNVSFM